MRIKVFFIIGSLIFLTHPFLKAGNPDRQGEAGAYELLLNPWARSSGLFHINTASVRGVEAMRINIAGLPRINSLEINLSGANYLQGTGIRMNAFGISRKLKNGAALGLSLTSLNFGENKVTTEDQPEGTGANFSPNFFNIALGYAYTFENKVSVGILMRGISESLANVSAFGLAIDAGVQYVTGDKEEFKFGISLSNVGSRMVFGGEGLSFQGNTPNKAGYQLTFDQRAAGFELPSMLNIGLSYDILIGQPHRISLIGNFTSNSFSRDQIGAGIEYALWDSFMLRGAYKYDLGASSLEERPVNTGLSAGGSIDFPLSKGSKNKIALDYAYQATRVWTGTHNVSIRFNF
jgi:long-subunit fatty acid transport protein